VRRWASRPVSLTGPSGKSRAKVLHQKNNLVIDAKVSSGRLNRGHTLQAAKIVREKCRLALFSSQNTCYKTPLSIRHPELCTIGV